MKEASKAAEEQERQEAIKARIAAEDARQKTLAEEKRIAQLRSDYEAALARGEDVEMPQELRPQEPTPPPQALASPGVSQSAQVAPEPKSKLPIIMGGLAACVAVAAVVYALIPPPPPPPTLQVESDITAAAALKEQKSEEELLREKTLANLKLERERKAREAEEAKKAALAKQAISKKRKKKKRKKKKPSINLNMNSF
jgi:hypothetical protein